MITTQGQTTERDTIISRVVPLCTEPITGFAVIRASAEECVASIIESIDAGDRLRWLACINPHSVCAALGNPTFGAALRDADWLVADGVGIVMASWILGGRIRRRITGSDIFDGVHRALNRRGGGRVYFIGSTQKVLAAIRSRMATEYPSVEVVGTYSPPFKPAYSKSELDEMVRAINEARPDVVWVGMTAPKQETWIHAMRPRLDAKFVAAVGAVFDFYAGTIKRSPESFQRLGLEWLPRLIQEPRRLWRRMFVSAPVFVAHVIRERFGRRGANRNVQG